MPTSGILLVDKPMAMTSHDLVNVVRKIFNTKKVGHNGTLDPDATGVMVLCIGQATRLNEYLTVDDKRYQAVISFGYETDTQDNSGKIMRECSLPDLSHSEFEAIVGAFVGKQKQIPPVYSAIKRNGKPLYQYAREGRDVPEIPARDIEIFDIKCGSYSQEKASIEVHCGKGTSIRTLCQDIARACESCGCMSALRRTAVGHYTIEQCLSIESLKAASDPYSLLLPMSEALSMPKIEIDDMALRADLHNGKRILINNAEALPAGAYVQAVSGIDLLAVGLIEGNQFVPKKVFQS